MYLAHFAIQEPPFSLIPDSSFFFRSEGAQAAIDVVRVALASGEGIIKITGEVGTGKTTLCHKLMGSLVDRFELIHLPNPLLTPDDLFRAVADEFMIPFERAQGLQRLLSQILRKLLLLAGDGRKAVILMDEAQALPDATLEALRLLTNLETQKEKLLQVVLFGQQELDQRLARPEARALRQRVTFSHRLEPLTLEETAAYITHRLRVAGWDWGGGELFSRPAVERVYQASGGVARVVNILCHKALLAAYGRGEHRLTDAHVELAIEDSEGLVAERHAPAPPEPPAAAQEAVAGAKIAEEEMTWVSSSGEAVTVRRPSSVQGLAPLPANRPAPAPAKPSRLLPRKQGGQAILAMHMVQATMADQGGRWLDDEMGASSRGGWRGWLRLWRRR